MKDMIQSDTLKQLPARLSLDPHFTPKYFPWQQRVCLAPDGDFYKSLHTPKADVVTAHIKTVTEHGIELTNGQNLETDVIVTATGLRMQFGGGIPLTVDGESIATKDKILWNGAMVQDVPNLFYMIGYTNASWTLGADDTAIIICRLLKYMKRNHVEVATPRTPRGWTCEKRSSWDLISTYVKAAEESLPKYGNKGPWRPKNNFVNDYVHARYGNITGGLHFVT
jgi:cation diffusion facilitator CzcD-associated flavoprotein CzcO